MTTLTLDTNTRKNLAEILPKPTLQEAVSFLNYLVEDPTFLNSQIAHWLEEAERAGDWYVAHRHDAPDGSCSLQVFVWPPGSKTNIHDHSS